MNHVAILYNSLSCSGLKTEDKAVALSSVFLISSKRGNCTKLQCDSKICSGKEVFVTWSVDKMAVMEDLWCGNRQDLGKKGEEIALEYLLQRGMKLLARNWRRGHKELDLVMEDGEFIRIVEVKSRKVPVQAAPLENINFSKRKNIIAAARGYFVENMKSCRGREAVFDVVSILFNSDAFKIEYIQDAFGPEW